MRTLQAFCVIALVGAGLPAWAKDGPCKLATKGDSPVARACKEGGENKARSLMKTMVAQAKKSGMDVECGTCHNGVDDGRYDLLKKDGREQFDKMLVVAKSDRR